MRKIIIVLTLLSIGFFLVDCTKEEIATPEISIKSRALSNNIQEAQSLIVFKMEFISVLINTLQEQNNLWDVGCSGYSKTTMSLFANLMISETEDLITLETEFETFAQTGSARLQYIYSIFKPYIEARTTFINSQALSYLSVLSELDTQCGTNEPRLDGRLTHLRNNIGWMKGTHRYLGRLI